MPWYCKDSLASASDSRAKSSSSGSRKTLLSTRVFIFPRSILDELVEKRARVSCHNCKECLEKDLSTYLFFNFQLIQFNTLIILSRNSRKKLSNRTSRMARLLK